MQPVTRKILDYFDQINKIPRCSRNEAALCAWLQQWASHRGFAFKTDSAGNLVVRIAASTGCEGAPAVVLQAHMDMVCEKTPTSTHDFSRDPIISHIRGEWVRAKDTTLGADNGIAIAYFLALVDDPAVRHPPLELLFTVDEESGLTGVQNLGPDMLSARRFINLDSEDEGVFTIGCAGGEETEITLNLQRDTVPGDWSCCAIVVGGLKGGHSGIDIHKPRANANKVLARTLADIRKLAAIRLVTANGGTRHNAIPRDAEAVIACPPDTLETIRRRAAETVATIRQEHSGGDQEISIEIRTLTQRAQEALSASGSDRIIRLLLALPHGVFRMATLVPGAVETSSNLAKVTLGDGKLTILTSQRSSVMSRLDEITSVVTAAAELAGAAVRSVHRYPAWPADPDSSLLPISRQTHSRLFGGEPVIQVIHAGLECAIVGDHFKGMDMISFGPTIRDPHSPDEAIYIPSIERVWNFLLALLSELGVNEKEDKPR